RHRRALPDRVVAAHRRGRRPGRAARPRGLAAHPAARGLAGRALPRDAAAVAGDRARGRGRVRPLSRWGGREPAAHGGAAQRITPTTRRRRGPWLVLDSPCEARTPRAGRRAQSRAAPCGCPAAGTRRDDRREGERTGPRLAKEWSLGSSPGGRLARDPGPSPSRAHGLSGRSERARPEAPSGLSVRWGTRRPHALAHLARRPSGLGTRVNRAQLEHVIRVAAAISADSEIVVVGSQAILGRHPNAPPELCVSADVDLYPRNHPERADLVEGSIGELSPFHETYGYYAQAVGPDTAVLPGGW